MYHCVAKLLSAKYPYKVRPKVFNSLLSTKKYKFKYDDVWQKCHGYGYGDMLKMDAF